MNSSEREFVQSDQASAVSVCGLDVRRGGRLVLPGLSLEISSGVVTALLGPSGCGKSTLIRAIVGVQTVAGGSISVLGRPAGSAELRQLVGYCTQSPSVYLDLTVRQNLAYFARVLNAESARIGEVIDMVDLSARADQLAGTLSGGERSRVSLAVALLGKPQLLVLDEPTVGLDPVLRQSLWVLFRSLVEGGITILMSTHAMDEADHCDELVLMHDGKIIATGDPNRIVASTGASDLEQAFIQFSERQ